MERPSVGRARYQGQALSEADGYVGPGHQRGVYRGVDVAEILRVSQQAPEALACCIAIGHSAVDTAGNARETARWMAQEGFTSLRLVTADYHMPRSLAAFRRAMPEVALIAHPVTSDNVHVDAWWRWPGGPARRAAGRPSSAWTCVGDWRRSTRISRATCGPPAVSCPPLRGGARTARRAPPP